MKRKTKILKKRTKRKTIKKSRSKYSKRGGGVKQRVMQFSEIGAQNIVYYQNVNEDAYYDRIYGNLQNITDKNKKTGYVLALHQITPPINGLGSLNKMVEQKKTMIKDLIAMKIKNDDNSKLKILLKENKIEENKMEENKMEENKMEENKTPPHSSIVPAIYIENGKNKMLIMPEPIAKLSDIEVPLRHDTVARILWQLADALIFLKTTHKVVYYKLAPTNVMFHKRNDGKYYVWLTDIESFIKESDIETSSTDEPIKSYLFMGNAQDKKCNPNLLFNEILSYYQLCAIGYQLLSLCPVNKNGVVSVRTGRYVDYLFRNDNRVIDENFSETPVGKLITNALGGNIALNNNGDIKPKIQTKSQKRYKQFTQERRPSRWSFRKITPSPLPLEDQDEYISIIDYINIVLCDNKDENNMRELLSNIYSLEMLKNRLKQKYTKVIPA